MRQLVRRCREAIAECRNPPQPMDEDWLLRNYNELAERFGGKRVAVLPPDAERARKLPDSIELDGHIVVASDSFEELRERLLAEPLLRDELPFMALVPKREERGQ